MSTILLNDLISQSEAARLRGVSRQAIFKLIQREKLKGYVVAGRTLVSKKEVLNFQEGQRGRPASPPVAKKKVRKA